MKIAVLTSGGDAPGMNACVRAVVRSTINYGYEAYGVFDGYKGLVEGKIRKLDRNDVGQILNRGGTILGSSRLESFKEKEVRQVAVDNLKALGIDNLVVIGGDGTFRGAMALNDMGINCIAVPGTIDNDIASTEFTIGFFTALDTAIDAIDKLRDTSFSHQRCTVVEVMGRNCGDLSIFSGIACGAEIVITKDTGYNEEEILRQVQRAQNMGKRHLIVVVAEHITDVSKLAKKIQDNSGYEARATVLGYIQRGGTPSAFDRILASKMGVHAVDLLTEGKGGFAIYTKSLDVGHIEINEALTKEVKPSDLYKYLSKLN
ncbi:MAG: 6-phosphofructokinase [Candidatus Izemoplasmatales bacterium]|jgi:6-phosphofructokinase 1|nr:6-phosphofructokinase [Candidatus Izemoplasmatales bacterium]MDD4069441.1 6-phosphofructokinase [Candidatus Izemoplasmatales bacterium]MDY0138547.1 6-phosphofructokinase [Candidatus Izemoplasmatales bacterium]